MQFNTECTHCKKQMLLSDSRLKGSSFRCPHCSESFIVGSDFEFEEVPLDRSLEYETECPACHVAMTASERAGGKCVLCRNALLVKDSESFIVKPDNNDSIADSSSSQDGEYHIEVSSVKTNRKSAGNSGGLMISMLFLFIVGVIWIWSDSESGYSPGVVSGDVTRDQFEQIEIGMTVDEVEEILDAFGTTIGDMSKEHTTFWGNQMEAGDPQIIIEFDADSLVTKKGFELMPPEEANIRKEMYEGVESEVKGELLSSRLSAVFSLLLALLMLASVWKIFEKAGRAGWTALIPIYNTTNLLSICGKSRWWVVPILAMTLSPCLPVLVFLAGLIGASPGSSLIGLAILGFSGIFAIAAIVGLVLWILTMVSLSHRFGNGEGFAVGLLLLPLVFFPILGFGDKHYSVVT